MTSPSQQSQHVGAAAWPLGVHLSSLGTTNVDTSPVFEKGATSSLWIPWSSVSRVVSGLPPKSFCTMFKKTSCKLIWAAAKHGGFGMWIQSVYPKHGGCNWSNYFRRGSHQCGWGIQWQTWGLNHSNRVIQPTKKWDIDHQRSGQEPAKRGVQRMWAATLN